MRLPRFEREVIERWVSGVKSNVRWGGRRVDIDLHKRQGSLLGNILNGGNSLIGDILGTNPKPTTTAQAKPTATQVVSNPPPAKTQAPPPPATTRAPAPTSQTRQPAPVLSSVVQKTSTRPVAIPVVTLPTTKPGNGVLPTTTAITFVSSTSIISLTSTSFILSTITSNEVVYPTTFATSTLTLPSTTRPTEDSTTMNAVMGDSMSGMGGISKMTILISILSILFGSLFILLISYYISKNYIKKRKITIALDMRISQLQQGDGPLPPVPMRERMRNDAMEFMLRFPRPPSLRSMGMGKVPKEKKRGGFEILR